MKKTQLKFLAVLASSLMAVSASAAEPCKAYLKLDLGYGLSSGTRLYGNGYKAPVAPSTLFTERKLDSQLNEDGRGFIGSAAVGYAFNDAMRAEVSFDFKPEMKAYTNNMLVETRELGGSAKVLYDFNNNTSITPFVFGGLGASNIRPTLKPYVSSTSDWSNGVTALVQLKDDGSYEKDVNNNIAAYQSLKMDSKTVMTYAGGFGLSFKGSDSINIDFTYGIGGKANYVVASNVAAVYLNSSALSSMPSVSSTSITEASIQDSFLVKEAKFKNQMDQSLTLGIRFTM